VPADLAVQIVNYRTKAHLGPCLESLEGDLASIDAEFRIFVLDNASGDDLSDLAVRHPAASFATAERNLGFGAAHNRLAESHDARAILLLNPDSEVAEPRTVARLLEALRAAPDVAAVGPRLVGADGGDQRWDHGELRGSRAKLARAAGHSYWRPRSEAADVAWVSGAAALLDRRHFDAVGGFDPEFFLYKEEEDLFLRIRQRGGRVRYEPSISVRHQGTVGNGRVEHLEASVARFREKHVRSRLGRVAFPVIHRQAVAWEGRLRRVLRRPAA
jgi:GT2 family glycosyltransferase